MGLSRFQLVLRRAVKRFIYSQLYLREALFILLGRARPLIRFQVEAEPPSIYFNFALRPEVIEGLEQELGLPHPLAPIRCISGEEPFHALTLNVYRVSGLANGLRAEWSLYIREPASGKPRYLIVEACADAGSMDPVVIVSRAGEVRHARSERGLETQVRSADGSRFRSSCASPDGGKVVRPADEWVQANDLIYWLNGICDRTFYDAGLAFPRATQLDPSQVEIEDGTRWGRLVEPNPRHVILFGDTIEFAISPWWNVDELASA